MEAKGFVLALAAALLSVCSCDRSGTLPVTGGDEAELSAKVLNCACRDTSLVCGIRLSGNTDGIEPAFVPGEAWLSVSGYDRGKGTFVLDVDANPSDASRKAVLTVQYGEAVATLVLFQDGLSQAAPRGVLGLELLSAGADMAEFSASPLDAGAQYCVVTDKREKMESMKTPEDVAGAFKETLGKMAGALGVPVVDLLLSGNLAKGTLKGLEPLAWYWMYGFHCSPEGTPEGELSCLVFRTGQKQDDPDPEPGDGPFSLTCTVDGTLVRISVVPQDMQKRYFFHYFTEEKASGADMKTLVQELVDKQLDWGEAFGMSVAEVLDRLLSQGEAFKDYDLSPSSSYVAFACGVDDNAKVDTGIAVKKFATGDIQPSDNVIVLELPNVGYTSVDYRVTTSNDDPYVLIVVAPVDWGLESAQEIIDYIFELGMDLSGSLKRGNASGTFTGLDPGVKHYAIAFGYVSKTMTTDPVVKEFTTLKEAMSGFVFEVVSDKPGKSVVTVTPMPEGQWYYIGNVPVSTPIQDIRNYWTAEVRKAEAEGVPLQDFWDGKLVTGTSSKEFVSLESGARYRPYAFAVDLVTGKPSTDIVLGDAYEVM